MKASPQEIEQVQLVFAELSGLPTNAIAPPTPIRVQPSVSLAIVPVRAEPNASRPAALGTIRPSMSPNMVAPSQVRTYSTDDDGEWDESQSQDLSQPHDMARYGGGEYGGYDDVDDDDAGDQFVSFSQQVSNVMSAFEDTCKFQLSALGGTCGLRVFDGKYVW